MSRTLAITIDEALLRRARDALARLRIDREGGEGTYDEMVRRIAEGQVFSIELSRSLDRANDRAERNIRDVLAVLEALAATPGQGEA